MTKYHVFIDGEEIYSRDDKDYALIDPTVTDKINEASSCEFTMPPQNVKYDLPKLLKSVVRIVDDEGHVIFYGRISEINIDFWRNKKIYCEGALAWLNDSLQPIHESDSFTISTFISYLINNHNSEVDSDRQIAIGLIDPKNTEKIYRTLNHEITYNAFKDMVLGTDGGYVYTTIVPTSMTIKDENGKVFKSYREARTGYFDTNDNEIEIPEVISDTTITASDGRKFVVHPIKKKRVTDAKGRLMPVCSVPLIKSMAKDSAIKGSNPEKDSNGNYYFDMDLFGEYVSKYKKWIWYSTSDSEVWRTYEFDYHTFCTTSDHIPVVDGYSNHTEAAGGTSLHCYINNDHSKGIYVDGFSLFDYMDWDDSFLRVGSSATGEYGTLYISENSGTYSSAITGSTPLRFLPQFVASDPSKTFYHCNIFVYGGSACVPYNDSNNPDIYWVYTSEDYPVKPLSLDHTRMRYYFRDYYGFWNKFEDGESELKVKNDLYTSIDHKNDTTTIFSTTPTTKTFSGRFPGYDPDDGMTEEDHREIDRLIREQKGQTEVTSTNTTTTTITWENYETWYLNERDPYKEYRVSNNYGHYSVTKNGSIEDKTSEAYEFYNKIKTEERPGDIIYAPNEDVITSETKTTNYTTTVTYYESTTKYDTTLQVSARSEYTKKTGYFIDYSNTSMGTDEAATKAPIYYQDTYNKRGDKTGVTYKFNVSLPYPVKFKNDIRTKTYNTTLKSDDPNYYYYPKDYGEPDLQYYLVDSDKGPVIQTAEETYYVSDYYDYELLNTDKSNVEKRTVYFNYFIDSERNRNYIPSRIMVETVVVAKDGKEYTLYPTDYKPALNYVADLTTVNNQEVLFGSNLQDLSIKEDASKVYSGILATGKDDMVVGSDKNAINGNVVYSDTNKKRFGNIIKTRSRSEISSKSDLKTKTDEFLKDHEDDYYELEATAIDLHDQNSNYDFYEMGQKAHVISLPHNINDIFPIKEITTDLNKGTRIIKTGTPSNDDLSSITKPESQADTTSSSSSTSSTTTRTRPITRPSMPTKLEFKNVTTSTTTPGATITSGSFGAGCKLVATYANGNTRDVTNYVTFSPSTIPSSATGSVTITAYLYYSSTTGNPLKGSSSGSKYIYAQHSLSVSGSAAGMFTIVMDGSIDEYKANTYRAKKYGWGSIVSGNVTYSDKVKIGSSTKVSTMALTGHTFNGYWADPLHVGTVTPSTKIINYDGTPVKDTTKCTKNGTWNFTEGGTVYVYARWDGDGAHEIT